MHSTRVLLSIAALAGTSLSQTSDSAFCSSLEGAFFSKLLGSAPTTPADILSFIATATGIPALPTTLNPSSHQDQLCAIATALPPSLLPEFQTFAGSLLSFGKSYSGDLIEYITDCVPEPEAASMTSYVNYVFTATGNICTETSAAATPGSGAPNGTYPTGTGSLYPTATGSSTLIPTAAAARATGALMGAAAVGGAIGAAML
ncbi:hypothetical protein FHL15_002610 [Xylaria flabelliformis]|uniref:Infection structure specific protein n=1 Tax=Xylaria flabelliformis TaxID=2512241 RepID=A0A553I819_9PEZI|nr:hypothetical protein FHL15_002610 [Xylaria flabelliformis]